MKLNINSLYNVKPFVILGFDLRKKSKIGFQLGSLGRTPVEHQKNLQPVWTCCYIKKKYKGLKSFQIPKIICPQWYPGGPDLYKLLVF